MRVLIEVIFSRLLFSRSWPPFSRSLFNVLKIKINPSFYQDHDFEDRSGAFLWSPSPFDIWGFLIFFFFWNTFTLIKKKPLSKKLKTKCQTFFKIMATFQNKDFGARCDLSKIMIFWSRSLFRFFVKGFSKSNPLKFIRRALFTFCWGAFQNFKNQTLHF